MKKDYRGIPKQHLGAVKAFMKIKSVSAVLKDRKAVTLTPQQAYSDLLLSWQQRRDLDEAQRRITERNSARVRREDAKEALSIAMDKLSDVREFLWFMETDQLPTDSMKACARFARALMDESGRELEQALFDVGAMPKGASVQFLDLTAEEVKALSK